MTTTPIYCAFFAATDDELTAAFPGWHRERTVDVDTSIAIPLGPPRPFAFAPLPDRWWQHLLEYYLLLCPDDLEAREALYDDAANVDERNGIVFPQVLFAGPTAPFVCRPREEFLEASAKLDDARCDEIAQELARLHYPERFILVNNRTEELDQLPWMEAYEQAARRALRSMRELFATRTKPIWFWGWYD